MRLSSFLILRFFFGLGLFAAFHSIAQPTVVIQNVKNACDGLDNGSFEILVTAANPPPLEANVFGPPNQIMIPLTVGVPFTVSNLPIKVVGYFVTVQDADGTTVLNVPILGTPVNLSASLGAAVMNTDCVVPNGSIDINVSGGSGSYSFQWTGPAGFTDPGTEDVSGLSGGSYAVTIFDNNTNCTRFIGPVAITDPSPIPFNVSTVTPSICLGDGATVNLSNSESPIVSYQIYRNGNPTGIFQSGVNGPLAFAIPAALLSPVATYAFTIEGVNGACAPVFMNGTANVIVNPLPTAVTSGGGTVCAGSVLPDVTFTFTGTAPFDFTYFDGTSSVNVAGHPATTFTLTTAPAGTYSVTALSDATSCAGTCLGGTVYVIVNPLPTAVTSGGGTVCAGSALPDVTFTFTGTAPFAFTYFDGTSSVNVDGHPAKTLTVTTAPAGTYNVTALTDATTCAATSLGGTVNVIVNPLPTAVKSGGGTVCAGSVLPDVTFTFTGTAPFAFTYFNGTSSVNVVGHPTNIFTLTTAPAGTYSVTALSDANGCVGTALGGTVDVIVNPLPTITLGANPVVCTGVTVADLTYSATTDNPDQFRVDWDASAEAAGLTDVPATALPASPISLNNIPIAGGVYSGTLFVINTVTGCESIGNAISVIVQQDVAILSGNSSTCAGTPAVLTVTFSGPSSSWDFTYTDGSSNFLLTANTSPFTFTVNPFISTTYSLVSVTGATCGGGTVSGSATVTVTPIGGNPSTFGSETWLGYAYDDSGSPAPPVSNIDFNVAKYRGFITETDIAGISAFSSYNAVTDAFDLNLSNVVPLAGPNICGTYLNDYSIRLRMTKTFTAGIYTFTVGSDDGVRLFVDGVNVLPGAAFDIHPFTTFTSTPQCLTAGTHDLVLEYFDRGGFSRLTFDFAASPAPLASSPVSVCVNTVPPTLTASSAGAIDFNWYTDAALTSPPIFTGTNYTPAASELNMGVIGSTSFFVTAVFACGETPAAQVTVDVVNGASITVPSSVTQICDSGGLVDLSTLVSAIPSGGVFTFSGTGVVASPDFDPSLVTGTTTITVDYVSGSCSASSSFDVEVVSGASITVPLQPVAICESSGAMIDLNNLVSASPSGGGFVFSGSGVTGFIFNPATLSGLVTVSVDYSIGGCAAPTRTFDFDVVSNASIAVDNSTVICSTDPLVSLLSLVTPNPAGGNFVFSGPGVSGNLFDPSAFAASMATINVGYDFSGCLSSTTLQITVRSLADPLCGGPIVTGNCNTVVITPMPAPAVCSPTDGSVFFEIIPPVPTVNNTGVRIDIVGISSSNNGVALTNFNSPTFSGLPVGTYDYTIEYGDPSCIKTGQVTVLLGPDVVDFSLSSSNASCFGSLGGVVISTINGSSQADYTYEITQLGSVVSSGIITQLESLGDVTLTGFGKGDFEIKLSQDQSATTSCPSPVQSAIKPFTVSGPDAALDTLFVKRAVSVPDLSTGSMTIGIQESLEEPYAVRLVLTDPVFPGQNFAFDFTEVQRNPLSFQFEMEVKNIFAGTYALSLRDSLGCQKDFQVVIGVDTNLMIPNVFTPNGDGVNEVFFIRNLPIENSVFISNRWGKEVFSSRNYQNDWNGGSIEDGVYYYRIIVEGKAFSGWLEILRDK